MQCGTLKIVDRKKNIFKLAQGEYIAPEKIENIYIRSDALAQVFVHGDSLQVGALCVCVSKITCNTYFKVIASVANCFCVCVETLQGWELMS